MWRKKKDKIIIEIYTLLRFPVYFPSKARDLALGFTKCKFNIFIIFFHQRFVAFRNKKLQKVINSIAAELNLQGNPNT